MRPDKLLIRRLMIDIVNQSTDSSDASNIQYTDYDQETIKWHLAFLIDSNFLDGRVLGLRKAPDAVAILGVKPGGYEFVEQLENETKDEILKLVYREVGQLAPGGVVSVGKIALSFPIGDRILVRNASKALITDDFLVNTRGDAVALTQRGRERAKDLSQPAKYEVGETSLIINIGSISGQQVQVGNGNVQNIGEDGALLSEVTEVMSKKPEATKTHNPGIDLAPPMVRHAAWFLDSKNWKEHWKPIVVAIVVAAVGLLIGFANSKHKAPPVVSPSDSSQRIRLTEDEARKGIMTALGESDIRNAISYLSHMDEGAAKREECQHVFDYCIKNREFDEGKLVANQCWGGKQEEEKLGQIEHEQNKK